MLLAPCPESIAFLNDQIRKWAISTIPYGTNPSYSIVTCCLKKQFKIQGLFDWNAQKKNFVLYDNLVLKLRGDSVHIMEAINKETFLKIDLAKCLIKFCTQKYPQYVQICTYDWANFANRVVYLCMNKLDILLLERFVFLYEPTETNFEFYYLPPKNLLQKPKKLIIPTTNAAYASLYAIHLKQENLNPLFLYNIEELLVSINGNLFINGNNKGNIQYSFWLNSSTLLFQLENFHMMAVFSCPQIPSSLCCSLDRPPKHYGMITSNNEISKNFLEWAENCKDAILYLIRDEPKSLEQLKPFFDATFNLIKMRQYMYNSLCIDNTFLYHDVTEGCLDQFENTFKFICEQKPQLAEFFNTQYEYCKNAIHKAPLVEIFEPFFPPEVVLKSVMADLDLDKMRGFLDSILFFNNVIYFDDSIDCTPRSTLEKTFEFFKFLKQVYLLFQRENCENTLQNWILFVRRVLYVTGEFLVSWRLILEILLYWGVYAN